MSASYIQRPDTAFSVTKQRRPRQHKADHLAFVRSLPCAICGTRKGIEAAHLRAANQRYGKRFTGMAEKPSDQWTTPLCADHHREQHSVGDEVAWWHSYGVDPFSLALALYGASENEETAISIIEQHR